jgi:hypothetical protein
MRQILASHYVNVPKDGEARTRDAPRARVAAAAFAPRLPRCAARWGLAWGPRGWQAAVCACALTRRAARVQ